jgi:hypothetical protein
MNKNTILTALFEWLYKTKTSSGSGNYQSYQAKIFTNLQNPPKKKSREKRKHKRQKKS